MGGDFMVNSPTQPSTRAFEVAEPVYMRGEIRDTGAMMETESSSAYTYQPTTDTISVEYVNDQHLRKGLKLISHFSRSNRLSGALSPIMK